MEASAPLVHAHLNTLRADTACAAAGSIDTLGATLWGQTELSCADDGTHGVWTMSYKCVRLPYCFSTHSLTHDACRYHASSLVFNHRNLLRFWDISYDGYVGGKDATILDWGSDTDISRFVRSDNNLAQPFNGPSIIVLPLPTKLHTLPSPLPIANLVNSQLSTRAHALATADLFIDDMLGFLDRVSDRIGSEHIAGLRNVISVAYDILHLHRNSNSSKCACLATVENEATAIRLAYSGTYMYKLANEGLYNEVSGNGHHGPDAVGKASERAGKGIRYNNTAPRSVHLI